MKKFEITFIAKAGKKTFNFGANVCANRRSDAIQKAEIILINEYHQKRNDFRCKPVVVDVTELNPIDVNQDLIA